ncbi:unnamed protein product [Plutella xylostella]|uniref:(diamondback moth) hypothetical protein n=1 Tax=Plutella xylostella TaxID=51655 RepID=A0A8S4G813_PLUXY|nr:unnamed protein product [Plutella xylostella]
MINMFEMWNTVSTKLEAQTNVQQSQQPHTSGGSIKATSTLLVLRTIFFFLAFILHTVEGTV